jgi:hypothetical protein
MRIVVVTKQRMHLVLSAESLLLEGGFVVGDIVTEKRGVWHKEREGGKGGFRAAWVKAGF